MERLFGTDGVRGVANEKLTAQLAFQLGAACAAGLVGGAHAPVILVGRDTRISGDMLESALVAGILSMGGKAIRLGVLPTPAVSHLVHAMKADAGAVISASHNAYEFNGIKFFGRGGVKLPDDTEDHLEALATGRKPLPPCPTGKAVGVSGTACGAASDYIRFLVAEAGLDLSGMRIALDCANGAASALAPGLLADLGAEVFPVHHTPDGVNINGRCGSTHPEVISAWACEKSADIGLAFDGDADRLLACDEHGTPINGDRIMALCAREMVRAGTLKHRTLVATVMSNAGMDDAMRRMGVTLMRTAVGDRYVLETMRREGYNLGGEPSGHIIFLDHSTTGDGMLTALKLLAALRAIDAPVSRQAGDALEEYPQVLKSARATERQKALWQDDPTVQEAIRRAENALGGEGRVFVRASGTEPLVRVLIEGRDRVAIERDASALVLLLESL